MRRKYEDILAVERKRSGFTIVELLIVIVIIGILTAIGTTVFASINNRAYDTSVQNDLNNIAKKLKLYHAEYGVYPVTAQLPNLGLKVDKSVYGSHYYSGSNGLNLVYCRMPAANPTSFALVAFSRSGNGFQYSGTGQLGKYTGTKGGSLGICTDAGVAITGTERDWFFENNAWQTYIGG